ncbi:MAG TPA: hypothetical protein VD963_00445 [Phycisphaerales bacterium]|nr:hypothetical protein [Phycisphaerales bacterium]
MNQYVAVLRLAAGSARRSVVSSLCGLLEGLGGVECVDFDLGGHCLLVWFDRSRVTLADLVRTLEDHGVPVTGVAQSRRASVQPHAAIA